jgi:hypothetical protein
MAMCYTLHYMIFEEIRPFDWIMLAVEILVLGAILIFEGPKWLHEIAARRKASKLAPFLASGEKLRHTISLNPNQDQNEWRENALKWDRETQEFLKKQSSRALSAFRHVSHVGGADRSVLTPDGQFYPVHGLLGDAFQLLQARLSNLHKIMENPEVYF